MITPILNNVLIKPLKEIKKTETGIFLPEAKKQNNKGKVIAKGLNVVSDIKIGKKVFYKSWQSNEIEDEGQKYFIIEDKDILAIYE